MNLNLFLLIFPISFALSNCKNVKWPKIEILSTSIGPQKRNCAILGTYHEKMQKERRTCWLGFATNPQFGKKNKMERKEEGWKNNLNTYFVDHLTYFLTFWYSIPSCFLSQSSLKGYSLNSLTIETLQHWSSDSPNTFLDLFLAYFLLTFRFFRPTV